MRAVIASALMIALAGSIATVGSASAAQCVYENRSGDKAFDVFTEMRIVRANAAVDKCPSSSIGTGMIGRLATCSSGYQGPYVVAPATKNGAHPDLLIFQNDIWYGTAACRKLD